MKLASSAVSLRNRSVSHERAIRHPKTNILGLQSTQPGALESFLAGVVVLAADFQTKPQTPYACLSFAQWAIAWLNYA